MIESGYYPPGAEFDPRAPYNQVEPPEESFDVYCSQTLSKSVTVCTRDYTCTEDGPDTSETNWDAAFSDDYHYTPLELIDELRRILKEKINSYTPETEISKFKRWIALEKECEGWIIDEEVIDKE